ncbi:MAG: LPS assembly lipoprotein LptE [Paludibacteraceae bacterium]|nr:LPS assembly lipoprotein LptE [Paludibacteraceae bacterium]
MNVKISKTLLILTSALLLCGCTISYKFNGTIIDYNKVKSISIQDFQNRAAMVYAPLTIKLNEEIRDIYTRQTRLTLLRQNGDLELEGEVTGYDLTPQAITSDNSLASETRLTIKINVRYTNNTDHEEDFERSYSAYRNFDSNRLLTDVQDELIDEILKEICENIYNDTVANW